MSDLLDRLIELERRIAILEAGTGTGLGGTDQTIKGCHDRLDAIMGAGKASTPMVRAKRTTNDSIADATEEAVVFGAEDYDTDTMHNNSTNPTRITFTTAGKYAIGGMVQWDAGAGATRWISVRVDGATTIAKVEHAPTEESMVIGVEHVFTAAQYVELTVYQDSGGPLNVLAADGSPAFWAHKIG